MAYVMTGKQLADKAIDIAKNYKTLYVLGCFGAPLNTTNKARYTKNQSYNKQASRTKMIMDASADTFGFDCVCLVKGILWGWNGNLNATYGGAKYCSNGVPDFGSDGIMNYCTGVSTNFSNLAVGEVLHKEGHVGIYIGNGLAVECTPKWKNDVQITAVQNMGNKSGYNNRTWLNHGKLKYVDYTNVTETKPTVEQTKPTVEPDKKGDEDYMFTVKTVKSGSKGESALLCQKLLRIDGYKGKNGKALALDGNAGSNTVFAITAYQKDKGLEADGVCGSKTWKVLLGV